MDEREKKEQGEGVRVTDHRRFTAEGEDRPGAEPDGPRGDAAPEAAPRAETPKGDGPRSDAGALPPIDFATFVLSLATSAQVHLGAIPNPATGKQEPELPLAKQTIDILGILEEKTKGNLAEGEAKLLEHVLFDLRMMYVELNKGR